MRTIAIVLMANIAGLATCGATLAAAGAEVAPQGYVGGIFGDGIDFNGAPLLLVVDVVPLSPAEWFGLRRGDVIKSINGAQPGTRVALQARIMGATPGDTVTFVVARGQTLRAVTVRVEVLTPEKEAAINNRAEDSARALTSAGHELVFIPHALCYEGVNFGQADELAAAPGAVSVPLSELQSCRHPVAACVPLALLRQSKTRTLVTNGLITYKLKGDWRAVSFPALDKCTAVIAGNADGQATAQDEK
jgi:membrane-associated protease RseP (regulator of RpoE activity)